MSFLSDAASLAFQQTGLEPFGIGMPFLSKKWCSNSNADFGGTITYNANSLSLTLANGETWLTPITAHVVKTDTAVFKPAVTLTKADGSSVTEAGLLFDLFPGAFQRLKRLYIQKLEAATPTNYPGKPDDQPLRPVPKYFFIASTAVPAADEGGWLNAGDDTGIAGELSFYDEEGHIIHPLMVASCFSVLASQYTALVIQSTPDQLTNIVSLESASSFTVRLIKPDGTPYDGQHIEGKTDATTAIGLFNATPSSSDTELKAALTRQADTGNTGAFPQHVAKHLHFGLGTFGRLGNRCGLPALRSSITLTHDFFTVTVVDTRTYLTGAPDRTATGYNGSRIEPAPFVRLHENLTLLPDGNALMGQLQQIFGSGATTESLVCAPDINPKFLLPPDNNLYWNSFPAAAPAAPVDDAEFPSNFKTQVMAASTAVVIDGSIPDVKLTLSGIPRGAAVRVYHRKFKEGAVLVRGDGAGGIANIEMTPVVPERTFNGQCVLRLRNPLGLVAPFSFSPDPLLIFDLIVVQRSGKKRIFGSLELPLNTTPEAFGSPEPADNAVAGAAKQGVSRAGVLGLHTAPASIPTISKLEDLLEAIIQLARENPPRDAPRMFTMARRDMMAAAKTGTTWKAALAGGSIAPHMHSAQQTLGSPGSQGGPETQYAGVFTQNAVLAYDVARMAFRRTTSFYDRIQQIDSATWDEPAPNTALTVSESPGDTRGTFAGAVLQNIAPFCETPEFGLLKTLIDNNITSIPTNWNALVDSVTGWINAQNLNGLPGGLSTAATSLRTQLIPRLNALKDTGDPSRESQRARLYNELLRELSAACYGRRDSQWALENAIKNARRFIYIETPGLNFTAGTGSPTNYTRNLKTLLQDQISSHPGLKVVLCTPKFPQYGPGYEQYQAKEVKDRLTMVLDLPTANVVCFHPVGFPGRPSNLESNVVIVDDAWALVGSSMFSRRGLTFDGSADMVFTDLSRLNGTSPSIAAFRKTLMATRLGISGDGFDSRVLMLEDIVDMFYLIRETLRDGGQGRIEPVWNGHTDGVVFSDPTLNSDLVNPEGIEFRSINALVFALLGNVPL